MQKLGDNRSHFTEKIVFKARKLLLKTCVGFNVNAFSAKVSVESRNKYIMTAKFFQYKRKLTHCISIEKEQLQRVNTGVRPPLRNSHSRYLGLIQMKLAIGSILICTKWLGSTLSAFKLTLQTPKYN